MGKKKRGRCVKNNKQNDTDEPEELKRAPHSFVFHRGRVTNNIAELTKDFRKVMEPFTASSLKARKKNSIKDFVSVAGVLHVSHVCIFTCTDHGIYMKIGRLPQGPTLTFWVCNYSLARDVISMTKKQFVFEKLFRNSPLIVLNSFSGEGLQMKLMASMFQNMFPTINLTKVKLSNIRRCVLLNYDESSKLIDFRHYAIRAVPVGLSKGVKKLVQSKIPNLGHCSDISEFISKSGQLSESEAEDDPASHVTLPQKLATRGSLASSQSALRLIEIGPRITLKLMKIEEGLLNGEVLFHDIVEKTEEEKLIIKKKREEKRRLKEKRKSVQEENKKKKEKAKEEHKQKSLKGMQKRSENEVEMHKAIAEIREEAGSEEEDNDAEWFRKEVGKDPEEDLFDSTPKQHFKRKQSADGPTKKRQKVDNFKYRSRTEVKYGMKNKFGKKPGVSKGNGPQKHQFHKRKVYGSKIVNRRKH